MKKEEALEWARKCRRYWDEPSQYASAVIANEIITAMTDCLCMAAEEGGWYGELATLMGWEE